MASFLDKLKPQYGKPEQPQKKRTSVGDVLDVFKPQYGREEPEPEPGAQKKRLSLGGFVEKLKPQASRESESESERSREQSADAKVHANANANAHGQEPASNTQPRVEPGQGQDFTIQPHPAKTNDPADEQRQQTGGGYNAPNGPTQAFHTPGPQIPTREQSEKLPPPKSHEELQARAAELNQEQNQR